MHNCAFVGQKKSPFTYIVDLSEKGVHIEDGSSKKTIRLIKKILRVVSNSPST